MLLAWLLWVSCWLSFGLLIRLPFSWLMFLCPFGLLQGIFSLVSFVLGFCAFCQYGGYVECCGCMVRFIILVDRVWHSLLQGWGGWSWCVCCCFSLAWFLTWLLFCCVFLSACRGLCPVRAVFVNCAFSAKQNFSILRLLRLYSPSVLQATMFIKRKLGSWCFCICGSGRFSEDIAMSLLRSTVF